MWASHHALMELSDDGVGRVRDMPHGRSSIAYLKHGYVNPSLNDPISASLHGKGRCRPSYYNPQPIEFKSHGLFNPDTGKTTGWVPLYAVNSAAGGVGSVMVKMYADMTMEAFYVPPGEYTLPDGRKVDIKNKAFQLASYARPGRRLDDPVTATSDRHSYSLRAVEAGIIEFKLDRPGSTVAWDFKNGPYCSAGDTARGFPSGRVERSPPGAAAEEPQP